MAREYALHRQITHWSVFSFKGFLQIYQLQTENDEEETWRDLVSDLWLTMDSHQPSLSFQSCHGFDRTLNLVATRREEVEAEVPLLHDVLNAALRRS